MYADDTRISFPSESVAEISEAVNSHLKRLENWFVGNKLSINVAKTQSMILGSSINLKKRHMNNRDSEINLHINEDNLVRIGSNKHQKERIVPIDSAFKWREHITFAIGKISSAMGMLKYTEKYLPIETVKNIYTSRVELHFRNWCLV